MPEPTSPLGTPRVLVPPPEGERHAHLAWPKLAVTSKGDLVLASCAARFHGTHGEGCPAVSVSTDGGDTFSSPQILATFGDGGTYTHCGNLAIGVTADDVVVLLAMAFRGDEANSIFGWASVDGGSAWQEINVAALAAGRTGSVYGHVFPVHGRGYAVCGHYRKGSYPHEAGIWISFSQDGLHWGPPEHVTDTPLVEPAVTCLDEDIVGLIRHPSAPAWSGYARLSANRRRLDWQLSDASIAAALPSSRAVSPFVTVDPDDPGRLLALFTERTIPGNTPGRITLWSSTSAGADWQSHGPVVDFPRAEGDPNDDFGYPWMVRREDGRWLMAFYYGQNKGPSAIWGLDFTI